MQSRLSARNFFLNSMGATLEVLAYFSTNKVELLLSCLSKKSQDVLRRKRQDITQLCVPSIFDARITRLEPVRHVNQDVPVLKLVHLRESLFIVAYINGLIEMIDFERPESEPMYRFQISH